MEWSAGNLEAWLQDQVADIHPGTVLSPSADFFQEGFDRYGPASHLTLSLTLNISSLSATILRRRIMKALHSSNIPAIRDAVQGVTENTVYEYPTIKHLSAFVFGLLTSAGTIEDARERNKTLLQDMVKRYGFSFEHSNSSLTITGYEPELVVALLTGSTGNLGSQILTDLLQCNFVKRVYCLNCPSGRDSMPERHARMFRDKGLDTALLTVKKLVFVEGDMAAENFGVPWTLFEEVRSK